MSVMAILNPTSLLGTEIRRELEQRRNRWTELRLLSSQEDEIGRLTEARGAAAVVSAFEASSLEGTDIVFFPGSLSSLEGPLAALPPSSTGILLAPEAGSEHGTPVVAGVNPESARRNELVVSPHPAVIAAAHLLHPLADLGEYSASATVILPASMYGQPGLDELFAQTREIITFAPKQTAKVFSHQMVFNLLPAPEAPANLGSVVQQVLASASPISMTVLQGGIFHGLSLSLHLRFTKDPGVEALHSAFEEAEALELVSDPESVGPVSAASRDEVLVSHPQADPGQPGNYWVWAVMDNLTRGGALNALGISEALS